MGDAARQRLALERKQLNAGARPPGCYARPLKSADGSTNLFVWECGIVPAATSAYYKGDGETLKLTFTFEPTYPATPPSVRFTCVRGRARSVALFYAAPSLTPAHYPHLSHPRLLPARLFSTPTCGPTAACASACCCQRATTRTLRWRTAATGRPRSRSLSS